MYAVSFIIALHVYYNEVVSECVLCEYMNIPHAHSQNIANIRLYI